MTADPLVEELTRSLGSPREARWLLEELVGMEPAARREQAMSLARRRASGEPLQYVLGHWPFRTLDLLVDRRALIPRPETELLVGFALDALRARGDDHAVVCDLGCGAGAIALSIAVETGATGLAVEVLASDVSGDALALAKQNAARTGASAVSFHEGFWFDALPVGAKGSIAVLCSNPPYVEAATRPDLARELDFEPVIALVSGDGADGTPGLADIEVVVSGAPSWLVPGGTLLVEHGAEQRAAVVALAERVGLVDVHDHDDLAGRARILEARRPL